MPIDARIPLGIENRSFAQPLIDLGERQKRDEINQQKMATESQRQTLNQQSIDSNNRLETQQNRELDAHGMLAIANDMEGIKGLLDSGQIKSAGALGINLMQKLEDAGKDTKKYEKILLNMQADPKSGIKYFDEALGAIRPEIESLMIAANILPEKKETFTTEMVNGVPVQKSSTTGEESVSPRYQKPAAPVETFTPVLNSKNQPVAQRSSISGKIISDPRADSGGGTETFTTLRDDKDNVIGQVNDTTGRVFSDPRASGEGVEEFETLYDADNNIIGQRNKTTGQVSTDPRASKNFAPPPTASAIQEFEFFDALSSEDKQKFMALKRANPNIDLGGRIVQLNPLNPAGDPLAELEKGLAPVNQPENIAAAEKAKQDALTIGAAARGTAEDERALSQDQLVFEQGRAQELEAVKNVAWARLTGKDEQVDQLNGLIETASAQGGVWTNGFVGSMLEYIPGTPAYNLVANLETIRANIGFDKLQEMRDTSPTGGALGQVSDLENRLLQAVWGNLENSQSPEQFEENLRLVQDRVALSWDRIGAAYEKDYGEPYWSTEGVDSLNNVDNSDLLNRADAIVNGL